MDPCEKENRSTSLWLWPGRRFTQTLGPLDDWKSKRIAQRNPFSWTRQAGRAARSSGTTGGLDEGLHAKKRRSERLAPHVGRRHQDGGVGSASSELERHCQLQRSRLDPYQKLRTMERTNLFQRKRERDDPTGTGKGKGTGKDSVKSSGRANSQKIHCWARSQQQSQGQSNFLEREMM